jgi:N-acetylglucosamine-6-phosphate deacetylase
VTQTIAEVEDSVTEWIEGRLADRTPVRVHFEDGRIGAVETIADGPDVLLLPGLVDLQVNGYAGFDVNSADVTPDEICQLVRALWPHGITSLCPTVITASADSMLKSLGAITAARATDPLVAHSIVAVHVEGPYLSELDGYRGAHPLDQIREPDLTEFEAWNAAADGLVRIVTLAPERRGATDYIAALAGRGIVVSIGHTAATPEQVNAAVGAGARMSTHLGNGSAALLPRSRNHVWPQLAADALTAGFIADGHHLPAETFTAMVRAKGVDRSFLVSDSAALAGCAPGTYSTPVGGQVTVEADGSLMLTGTEYLAGSGNSLDECVAWAAAATPLGLDTAIRLATANPARLLQLADRGRLDVGAAADVIAVDISDGFAVRKTVVAGETVH